MKFKRHNNLEFGLRSIDIAPLINVIFLLLIFFLLSSTIPFQRSVNVKLPKAITSDVLREENIIISITSENVTYLNDKVLSMKEMEDVLRKIKSENQAIIISADRRASVGRIVDIWDLCRIIGIEKINIATYQDN